MDLPEELRLIHQPVRLRIMGLLYKHRDVGFTRARDTLGLTDGNLASHANRLAEAGFLEPRDALTRGGFEKRYRITQEGARAFRAYLAELQGFLADVETGEREEGAEPGATGDPHPA